MRDYKENHKSITLDSKGVSVKVVKDNSFITDGAFTESSWVPKNKTEEEE